MAVTPAVGSEPVAARPGVEHPAVRIATADDVPRLASVLADAFMNDPVYTWMLPSSLRLNARLREMFTAELEQYGPPQGTVWTTAGCDGAVVHCHSAPRRCRSP